MSIKAILLIILAIMFLIFVFQNIQTVSVHFLIFEMSMPRALLLTITWAIGLLIGIFIPFRSSKSQTRD